MNIMRKQFIQLFQDKRSILLVFFWISILFSQVCDAQNLDSLRKYLNSEIDSVKINSYYLLARELADDPATFKEADSLANLGLQLSKSLSKNFQAEMYFAKAYSLYKNSRYENAIIYFDSAASIYQTMETSSDLMFIFMNKGNIYSYLGNYPKAIEMELKALKVAEELKDKKVINATNSNIGWFNYLNNSYDAAKEYTFKALKGYKVEKDSVGIGQSHNNLGAIFAQSGDLQTGVEHFESSREIREKLGLQRALTWTYNNLGSLYYMMEKYKLSNIYLTKALARFQIEENKIGEATTLTALASNYYTLENYSAAIQANKNAILVAKEFKYAELLSNALSNQAEAYAGLGDFKKAFLIQLEHEALTDSILNKSNSTIIAEMQEKYEVEKKEKLLLLEQTKTANQEKQLAQSNLKISNRNKWIYSLLGGSLALIFFGLFLLQRNRAKAKAEKDEALLKEKAKGLAAIIHVQEDERKRIAKDLHDGIVQQLGGLKLGLQKVFSGKETDETAKIVKVLDSSAQELRELSHRMMPRSLSELGLIPALDDMLENSLAHGSIQYQFEHFGISDRFKENIEIAIYRIAQELVNNIIKHSQASKANIQLIKTGHHILLIVEDNGKGMNLSNRKDGIGLMNISSRLDTINGKVNYEPSPESGTLATIKIPLV